MSAIFIRLLIISQTDRVLQQHIIEYISYLEALILEIAQSTQIKLWHRLL